MGTVTVDDSRYALTTQEERLAPLRSVTIRGRAVPTTVWSNEARNIVSRIAPRIVNFARGANDISDGAPALGSVTVCSAAAGRRSSTVAIFLVLCLPSSVGQQLQCLVLR